MANWRGLKHAVASVVVAGMLALLTPIAQAVGGTEVLWYGHAAFKVTTPQGHVLMIDPWLDNPLNPTGKSDADALKQVDLVLVTHGHFDHVGQAAQIGKQTGAKLVATYDLGKAISHFGGYPPQQAGYDSLGNAGGTLSFFDGEVRITFVPAVHSSALNAKDMGLSAEPTSYDAGNAGGFVIQIQNGPTIYHTGDTDVFEDMKLIGKLTPVDVMLTCIGDHFTMGPERAALAVSYVQPKMVVPMHYGTFPTVIPGSPDAFAAALKSRKVSAKLVPLAIGEPHRF